MTLGGDPLARSLRRSALAAVVTWASACGPSPGPLVPPPTPGIEVVLHAATCTRPEADADRDGLDDGCEIALAQAFAPLLRVDERDCSWTAAEGGLAGGYLFAAKPIGEGVRLAYLPAYYRDCGWTGVPCWIRGAGCTAHAGDSELIIVDVIPRGQRWVTVGVFLSAHCFGSNRRCRWYRDGALDVIRWADHRPFGAPEVWVARGKHAHYPSQAICDRGHWHQDTCDRNDVATRFPVRTSAQNIGSGEVPAPAGGCLSSVQLPLAWPGAHPGTRECLWNPASPFRGWQAERDGEAPSAYARYLKEIGGF